MQVNMEWLYELIKAHKKGLLTDAADRFIEGCIPEEEYVELMAKSTFAAEQLDRLEVSIRNFIREANKL